MKKKMIAVIGVILILASVLLVACTKNEAQPKEVIGIIGALPTSLKEAANITNTTKIAEMEFCEGTLGDKNIVIVKCAMGKVNAGI